MGGGRERLPLHELLDALQRWERAPGEASRRAVAQALARTAEANGAEGAYIELEAPPLAPLHVGSGALRRRPTTGRRLERRDLHAVDGTVRLGTLWLRLRPDAAADDRLGPPLAARAIEVAFDAAWSRARQRVVTQRLEALDEAVRYIATVLSVERVLQMIVDRVRELAECRYAALATVDDDGQIDRFVSSGLTRREREAIGALPRGRGLLGVLIREARVLNIADIAQDARAYGFPAHHPRMRSFLGTPLTVKGRTVGNLYLADKVGAPAFSADDERLIATFALHAGIAIENARLLEQVQRLVVVEERQRIGKDLHDGIIQAIYAVGLNLENVAEQIETDPGDAKIGVERAIDSLNLAIADIRNFIFGLRPELLEGADIGEGLRALAEEFRINTLVDIDVAVPPAGGDLVRPEQTAQLLQMAREALSNVARHARATRASVRLDLDGDDVVLTIADNGTGFDPRPDPGPGHLGLRHIVERTRDLGGNTVVDSAPGRGATVVIRIPRRPVARGPVRMPAEGGL